MVGADVAERLLTQLGDEIAQTALIQKGAPLVMGQDEAGWVSLAVNTGLQALPQFSFNGSVAGQSLLVHVDLPAHTAGVTTVGGDTVESGIVIRYKNRFHDSVKKVVWDRMMTPHEAIHSVDGIPLTDFDVLFSNEWGSFYYGNTEGGKSQYFILFFENIGYGFSLRIYGCAQGIFLKTGIIKKSGLRNRRRPQIETYPYKFIREKRKGIPKAFTG